MAARSDPWPSPSTARRDAQTAATPNAFAELSAAEQAVVFDLVAVFLGDALAPHRASGRALDEEDGERDVA